MRAVFRRWLAAWVAQEPKGLREVCSTCHVRGCEGSMHYVGVHDKGAES